MKPRVLLSSVFKPFGVDSLYSRKDSITELCRNQLTKVQGVFGPRTRHNSNSIHTIANNIDVPTVVLDWPTFPRYKREVAKGYEYVGITSIVPNFQKVKAMVEATREISPKSKIILGGFCATIPDIKKVMDVDYVCVGEGISFMRELLGLNPEYQFRNPDIYAENVEIFGIPLFGVQQNPHVVIGLGCSYGCDFCSPSHFFGRKHIRFIKTGRELLDETIRVQEKFRSNVIIFIGDDNFLLDFKRAEEFRELVVQSGRFFKIFLFGSADRAIEFGPERLAEMGMDTIWIGRESKFGNYNKNRNIDVAGLIAELKRYGIKTVLSTILLLDEHTKENVHEDIEEHLRCKPALSQFAHYAPVFGTPLYDRMEKQGRILTAVPFEEWHAFRQPWYTHPEFNLVEAQKLQNSAYMRDFLELGPAVIRFIEAEYTGWQNLKDSPKPHFRTRAQHYAADMWKYRAICLATEHLAPNEHIKEMAKDLRAKLESSFGPTTPFEKLVARGFHAASRFREFRTRRWGDAIQPKTRLIKYNF